MRDTQLIQLQGNLFEGGDTDARKFQTNLLSSDADEWESSPMRDFYKDQTIFVTGATGFLGSLLVEKLLRCCPIRKIILLVRAKGAKSVNDRLQEYFSDDVFDQMRMRDPKYHERVAIVCGALDADNYDLSPEDDRMLTSETSIVFHIAATVRFDEDIRKATDVNVKGTQTAVQLAKRMPRLKSFVHVSTAYCNCEQEYIEEKFYPPTFTAQELSTLLTYASEEELNVLTEIILERKPNTYTLTKATAEEVVREAARELPICVFRPSIVYPTLAEPLPLWFKGLSGALAFLIVGACGVLRVFLTDLNSIIDIIPADRAINALAALAWYQTTLRSQEENAKVFNYVSYNQNRLTQRDFIGMAERSLEESKESCNKQVWKRHRIITKSPFLFSVLFYIIHSVPALIFSLGERLTHRKPMVMKVYRKIVFNFIPLTYFSLRSWSFEDSNTKRMVDALSDVDRKRFDASMASFRWGSLLPFIHRSGALYFFKTRATKEYYQKHIVPIDRFDFVMWAVIYAMVGYLMLSWVANLINSYCGLS